MNRVTLAVLCAVAVAALTPLQPTDRAFAAATTNGESTTLGGRKVDIWRPSGNGAAPVIIFSHGYLGCPQQSSFLTRALADAGYLVVAPQHADSVCGQHVNPPEVPFWEPQNWSETT